jgi:transcriptional regulator with XRE-family HTH domain
MEYPEHLHIAFGRTLRAYRKNAGLTQAALAKQAGTSISYIGYLEAGKRMPTLATFLTLATVMDTDPQELLGATIRLQNALQGQDKESA